MHTKANSTPAPRHLTKKLRPLLALAGSLAAASVLHAQTTWTGATDNDFGTAGNWSNGTPNNSTNPGTISGGTPSSTSNINGVNITQSGGTFSYSGTLQSGTTWNLNGGVFDISTTNRFNLGTSTTLNVNGGNLTSTGGGQFWVNSDSAAVNILSNLTTSALIWQRLGTFTIDNSTLQIGTFQFANNTSAASLTLQNGATLNATTSLTYGGGINTDQGQITFTNGANTLTAAAWSKQDDFQFDFTSTATGSTISIASGFYDQSAWEARWSAGELTVDGTNIGAFGDYFTVAGNTLTFVGSTIPEPSSFALIGAVGALAFAGARRRRHAL